MNAVLKRCAVSALLLLLAGCSSSTTNSDATPAPAPAGPPQLVTAKAAFGPLYKGALSWAPDLVFLGLQEKDVPGFQNADGKAAMWEATFASPAQHKYRVDTYSIVTVLPDIHKGTDGGIALPWAGATRDAMPIDPAAFEADSDAVYSAAAADAADWLKKNPDKKLSSFGLGNAYQFHRPVWFVVWGDKKSGYIAYVDAVTGKVVKK